MKTFRFFVLPILLIGALGCDKDPETAVEIELEFPAMDEVIRDVTEVDCSFSTVVTPNGSWVISYNLRMGTDPNHLELVGVLSWPKKMEDLEFGKTYYWQIEAILENENKSYFSDIQRFHTSLPNVTNLITDTEDMTLNITWEDSPLMEYLEFRLTPELAEMPNPIKVNKGIGRLKLKGLTNIVRYDIHFQAVDASGYTSLPDSTWDISYDPTVSIKDADKNLYNIVTIGNQIWMRDNLKATRYSDSGEPFPAYTHIAVTTPSGNEERFYNVRNFRKLLELGNPCPCGFRVPTDEDFIELERYIQMPEEYLYMNEYYRLRGESEQVARYLKSEEGWKTFEGVEPGVDFYGFNAYPVGIYGQVSTVAQHIAYGKTVKYLTQPLYDNYILHRDFDYRANDIKRYWAVIFFAHFSVRCVKDVEE